MACWRIPLTAALVLLSACATLPQAAFKGDVDRVAAGLSAGKAAIGDRYDEGGCIRCTLLHYAAGGGWVAVVRLLAEKGADVNVPDGGGMTPLHHASARQQVEAARFLLASGAKPSLAARDPDGNTPLLLAVASPKEREAWIFTVYGPIATTVKGPGPSVGLVELLLADGADIQAATNRGDTPLHLAASLGNADVVRVLLARGADREARNGAGATPAALAASHGRTEVLGLLHQPGAR
ncbi:MAG TPA: ankyrin repeat domain-containing protein [Anaeromyxobacteraceae bacterium]|nr:ankyrin repeat domain-containing protein [Anaeromyxobacteraceae bacterium]